MIRSVNKVLLVLVLCNTLKQAMQSNSFAIMIVFLIIMDTVGISDASALNP